jgi:hypothetical protein
LWLEYVIGDARHGMLVAIIFRPSMNMDRKPIFRDTHAMKAAIRSSGAIPTLILLLVLIPEALHAQWEGRIPLSNPAGTAQLNENMATCLAASGGTLHVVWSDRRGHGSAIYYRRSTDTGSTWSTEIAITDTAGTAAFPAIAISGSTVHVVWMDSSLGHRASLYKRSLDGGETWGTVVVLDSNTAFWPGLAATGSTVVVSLNKRISATNTEVFFRSSGDNGATWGAEQQISDAEGRSEDPAIAAEGSYIHLAWNDNRNGPMEIYYRRSSNGGASWGAETQLVATSSYTTMVSLDGSNVDVPCGNNSDGNFDVWLRQSPDTGSSWEEPRQLTSDPAGEAYPYVVRDGPNLHMVYIQFGSGVWYMHSNNGGATWAPPASLGMAGQPFIAITGCALHAIGLDSGVVYYRRNRMGNCGVSASITAPSLSPSSTLPLSIYANPATRIFTVQLPGGHFDLVISDLAGKRVFERQEATDGVEIDCRDFPEGTYVVRATARSGELYSGRVVVRK